MADEDSRIMYFKQIDPKNPSLSLQKTQKTRGTLYVSSFHVLLVIVSIIYAKEVRVPTTVLHLYSSRYRAAKMHESNVLLF